MYTYKFAIGTVWEELRCQNKHKKRYASGRERRGKVRVEGPFSVRHEHIEARSQIGHLERDTRNWSPSQAYCCDLSRAKKSGYALIAKISNKTTSLVSRAIVTELNFTIPYIKTLAFDNGKVFAEHSRIDRAPQSTTYFADPHCQLAMRIKRKLQWLTVAIHPEKKNSIYCVR
jgi:IS30 family transposase